MDIGKLKTHCPHIDNIKYAIYNGGIIYDKRRSPEIYTKSGGNTDKV